MLVLPCQHPLSCLVVLYLFGRVTFSPVCLNTVGLQLFIAYEKETILLNGVALIHEDISFTGRNTGKKWPACGVQWRHANTTAFIGAPVCPTKINTHLVRLEYSTCTMCLHRLSMHSPSFSEARLLAPSSACTQNQTLQ